jgi:hypothetical protein
MSQNSSQKNNNNQTVKSQPNVSPMAAVLKILKEGRLKNSLSSVLLTKKSVIVMLLIIVGMLVAMILQTIAIIIISKSKTPEPVILATNSEGGVTRVLTLSSPNISMRGLTNKVAVDVGYCLTFDSNTYEAVSQYCSSHVFTEPGFKSFKAAIEGTAVGSSIQESKPFIIDSSTIGIPILSNEGKYLFGYDAVEIEVPLHIKTEVLGLKPASSRYLARLRMIQVSNPESTNAYKINEIRVVRVNDR